LSSSLGRRIFNLISEGLEAQANNHGRLS
jgi:hypothetical protein